MVEKRGLPDDLKTLLNRLVMNGSIRIAGVTLFTYFKRCWHLDDELAAYFMRRYFEKYHAKQLQRYQERVAKG